MIGLDTNVLVRYLVRDDEPAFLLANKLIRSATLSGDTVVVGTAVLLETEWVLRSSYKLKKAQIITVFDGLGASSEVRFEDEWIFDAALYWWKNTSADFADCVIVAKYLQSGCTSIATFDRKAAALPGTNLLSV